MHSVLQYRLDAANPPSRACFSCVVRSAALFGPLGDTDLNTIQPHIVQVHRAVGEALYEAGDPGESVYTLRSGIVRLERVSERGDRRIVRLAGCGDLLGQEVLLGGAYSDDAIACTPVTLCRIPSHVVQALGTLHPALMRELMQRWQRALEDSHDWVAELATGPARRRVLKLLLKLGEYAQGAEPLWLPKREDIGAMLNLTVETCSRHISQLRRDGLLSTQGNRRAWVDMAALREALRREDIAA
jgi:CRP/FNR family transcriptional regulator